MYELHQVAEHTYYIDSPAKIGIVTLNDKDVFLIDSGNDRDSGRRVLKILKSNNWNLKTIYNTHSNADHIGGNKYLQTQTGCKIFVPGIEATFTKNPILEPSFLYGAFPFKTLRHKFLLAQESEVENLTEQNLPDLTEMIKLPGHFFDMVGFRTCDDVVFLADCPFSQEILEKYQLTFIYDVEAFLSTLEEVKSMEGKFFIPAHAEVTRNIKELAQFNMDKVRDIADNIVEILTTPLTFERVLQKIFTHYDLTMTAEQYVLVGSTVRSYLSWLSDSGRIEFFFKNNEMFWRKV